MAKTNGTRKSSLIFLVRKGRSELIQEPMTHSSPSASLSLINTENLDLCCAQEGKKIRELCEEYSEHALDLETFSILFKEKDLIFNLLKEKTSTETPCSIILAGTTVLYEGEEHVPTIVHDGTSKVEVGIFPKDVFPKPPVYVMVYKKN